MVLSCCRPRSLSLTRPVHSESHVGAGFVATFGEALSMLRKLFQTSDSASQPFVLSGSGTLGWDLVAANLVEPGEDVLVLGTGYFSDGFADCLRVYGASVTELKAPVGSRPQLPDIEKALSEKKYRVLTVTHVDTSTGVLSELKALSALVRKVSPDTLLIVDGVCSVASEEIAFDEWQLDGVVTASQKAIGVPAGLSISMFSGRAIQRFLSRKTPPASYFASMKNWTPSIHPIIALVNEEKLTLFVVMQNYEAKKPSYFATPSPQLIHALHTALVQILARPLAERFAKHIEASDRVKKAVTALGLKQVAAKPEDQAHGMTAMYLPDTVKSAELLPNLAKKGVIFAGGIHKEIAPKYVRFGHMGVSVVSVLTLRYPVRHTDHCSSTLREATSTAPSRLWRMGSQNVDTRRPRLGRVPVLQDQVASCHWVCPGAPHGTSDGYDPKYSGRSCAFRLLQDAARR